MCEMYDIVNKQTSVFDKTLGYYGGRYAGKAMFSGEHQAHWRDRIKYQQEKYLNEHKIDLLQHGITPEDVQILNRILVKDYPTESGVGRKRGAILRYIKDMREKFHSSGERSKGKQLLRTIKRNET